MDYSIEHVKMLYDKYGIRKNDNGEFVIVERKNDEGTQNYGALLDSAVKFAHTWVGARQNGRSRTTSALGITEEEYVRAFDDQAKELYDYIMEASIQTVEAGSFLRAEGLAAGVSRDVPVPYAKETALGLYSNNNTRLAFEQWVRSATETRRNETGINR